MKELLLAAVWLMMGMTMNAKTREIHLKWIHTSDVHGSLFSYDYLRKKVVSGGLSAIYGYTLELRQQYGDRLILTDGGDCLQGQPTAYYYNFVDTVSSHLVADAMNMVGYDCGAMGNHDIETGHAVYDRWVKECKFPVLGANVIDIRRDEPYLQPYLILYKDGVKIAILGMLTPGIPNWLPEQLWAGLRIDDIVESARQWVRVIQEREHPDLMVGLFHSGYSGGIINVAEDGESLIYENAVKLVAEQVPGFDLICYGHDHQPAVYNLKNTLGQPVVAVGPTSQGKRVAEIDIFLTMEEGRVIGKKIEAKTPLVEDNSYVRHFESAFARQRQTLKDWVDQPIGTLTSSLYERDAFFGPSEFVDLIHQMQLDLTGADVSFAAPLSFDARLQAGTIRVSDMFALYKYENFLYTMRLTGREIKGFLEMSYALWTNQMKGPDDHIMLLDSILDNGRRQGLKNLSYNMDSAAGILYTVDVSKPEGQRIVIESLADGTPFDLDREYKVAVNSYRGNGGGELLTRGAGIPQRELKNRILTSTEQDLRFYLMQRIIEQKTITPAKLNHWRFVPDEWAPAALERDRKILFPNSRWQ
ncbi:MAG: 5'-nucleotidase C-terminal domain-containing protein [Bacteroidaceae bacterium]|nr:5'-nucleotidase C-terminal domain-containing protein [Bacteroidaceae bacterium]